MAGRRLMNGMGHWGRVSAGRHLTGPAELRTPTQRGGGGSRRATVVALSVLASLLVPGLAASSAEEDASALVANGTFEAPDVGSWAGAAGAQRQRSRVEPSSFHGGHALAVTSSGLPGSGVATSASQPTSAGLHVMTVAVKGTETSLGKAVQIAIADPTTGLTARSAPAHLRPWWQTLTVTARTSGVALRFAVVESADGAAWRAGDAYLVDGVEASAAALPTLTISQRQLLVNGTPYAIRGYSYLAAPVGAPPAVPSAAAAALNWNTNPAQCQTDAQLMKAGGINTLRIVFLDVYDERAYQCMDAFHGAGIALFWLVNGPQSYQAHDPAFQEAFWLQLKGTIDAVKDHPATFGYLIGNENGTRADHHRAYFPMLEELARRAKQLDPAHLTSTSLNGSQFYGQCTPNAGCWGGVGPAVAPSIDLWGLNRYSRSTGYAANTWQGIIDKDPSRPAWITEFGTDRYRCVPPPPGFGLHLALHYFVCADPGSGEDARAQADWNATAWTHMEANLSVGNPQGAVVGGAMFMWSDLWWFALALFTGTGTPATHDVSGLGGPYCNTTIDNQGITVPGVIEGPIVLGDPGRCAFTHSITPDGHMSPEWFGSTHAMTPQSPGPRVTTLTYDRMAELYSGTAGPVVTATPSASPSACAAVVTWTTDVPTYSRADYGLEHKVAGANVVHSENFVGDHVVEGTTLTTAHSVTLTGLLPGQAYRVYARGFDSQGRSGTADGVSFTTPAGTC